MNVTDQTFGVEVVKVNGLDHDGSTLSWPGKKEGTRFPSATEASTTKLLNRLLPQVQSNLQMGPAWPQPQTPANEQSKCPYNHCC